MCGGRLRLKSETAATMVEQGRSIGDASVATALLRPRTNHRLALLDRRGNYVEGLEAIAADSAFEASEALVRSGRIAEVVGIVLLGALTLLFAVAIYLPLFTIPKILTLYGM